MTDTALVDLFSPEFRADPHPTYARLRSSAPVHRAELPNGQGVWLITRYEDVAAVFKDRRFVKDWRNAMTPEQVAQHPPEPEFMHMFSHHLLREDPPNHTRLRGLVSKAFTPRLIEGLWGRIQGIADNLLDAVQNRGQMDLIDDYAFPLPITIIAELLGVPREDQEKFRRWSIAVTSGPLTPEYEETIKPQLLEFAEYLKQMFQEREKDPRDDLVSALIEAEEAGDKLSEDELYSMVFLLLIAGHETTVNLIGNGILALLQHPEQLELLRRQPELLESTVEEVLRYNGPVETSTYRFAAQDIELGGVVIPRGELVLVVIASANRDSAEFPNPDVLDISRENPQQVGFGHGIHYCLGAPLARLEAEIAFGTLLRRMPNLRLNVDPETLAWHPGLLIRGVQHLPVAF